MQGNKFQAFFCLHLMAMLNSSWKSKIHCLKIFKKSHNTNKKIFIIQKCLFMLPVLGGLFFRWGSFCTNQCISAASHAGNQLVAHWGVDASVTLIAACSSPVLLGPQCVIFLSTILHRFSVRLRSDDLAGQSTTVIPESANQLLVVWALQAVLEKEIRNSGKPVSRQKLDTW